jgi:hypothetical protein
MIFLHLSKKLQFKILLFNLPSKVSKTIEGYVYFLGNIIHMRVQGLVAWLLVVKKS